MKIWGVEVFLVHRLINLLYTRVLLPMKSFLVRSIMEMNYFFFQFLTNDAINKVVKTSEKNEFFRLCLMLV